MRSLTTDTDGPSSTAREGAMTVGGILPESPGPPEDRPRGRTDHQRRRSWAIRMVGRAKAWIAVGEGRCPGAEALLAAWPRRCGARAFRLALRKWAAREAARLAPEVVRGTETLLFTRSAIRRGPFGEPRPIGPAPPGRFGATAWKSAGERAYSVGKV